MSLSDIIAQAYAEKLVSDVDILYLIPGRYSRYDMSYSELKQLIYLPYVNGTYTKTTLRHLIIDGYKEANLTKVITRKLVIDGSSDKYYDPDTMGYVVVDAYDKGMISRDDLHWFTTSAFKTGSLTKEVMHFLLIQYGYRNGLIKMPELKEILTRANADGEVGREQIKWMITAGYAERDFNETEITYKDVLP